MWKDRTGIAMSGCGGIGKQMRGIGLEVYLKSFIKKKKQKTIMGKCQHLLNLSSIFILFCIFFSVRYSIILPLPPKCVMGLYTHKNIRNCYGKMGENVIRCFSFDSLKLILLSSLHWLSMIIINSLVFLRSFLLK